MPTVLVTAGDLGLSPETGDLDALEVLPMSTVLGKIQLHGIQDQELTANRAGLQPRRVAGVRCRLPILLRFAGVAHNL